MRTFPHLNLLHFVSRLARGWSWRLRWGTGGGGLCACVRKRLHTSFSRRCAVGQKRNFKITVCIKINRRLSLRSVAKALSVQPSFSVFLRLWDRSRRSCMCVYVCMCVCVGYRSLRFLIRKRTLSSRYSIINRTFCCVCVLGVVQHAHTHTLDATYPNAHIHVTRMPAHSVPGAPGPRHVIRYPFICDMSHSCKLWLVIRNETKSNKTPSLRQGTRTHLFWNFLHYEHVNIGLQVLVKSPEALSAASCAFEPTSSPPFQQKPTHTPSRESAHPPPCW